MDAVSSVAVEDGLLPRGEVFGEDFYAEDTPTAGVEGKTEGKTTTTKTEGKTEIAIKTEGKTEIATKPEWTLTTFSRTPKMSTYLVAWANGKFYNKKSYYVSPITGKRVELGVWATWDHIAQLVFRFLLSSAIFIFLFLLLYWGYFGEREGGEERGKRGVPVKSSNPLPPPSQSRSSTRN